MAIITVLIFSLCIFKCSATFADIDCAQCEWVTDSIGYLPHEYCGNFIQCQPIQAGGYLIQEMCCPDGLVWNQEILSCIGRASQPCIPGDDPTVFCQDMTTIRPCSQDFRSNPFDPSGQTYFQFANGRPVLQSCAPGTVWSMDNCTCIHGGEEECDSKLVNFMFTQGDDEWLSDTCNNVLCYKEGDAFVDSNNAMYVDGDGDYCHFSVMKNLLANNPVATTFSISFWFKQNDTAYSNEMEGMFGNGDCYQNSSITVMTYTGRVVSHAIVGHIITEGLSAFFHDGANSASRHYNSDVWTFVAMVYDGNNVDFWLGEEGGSVSIVQSEPANGPIENTQVASTIGMSQDENCDTYFFTGYIDDLCIDLEALSNDTIIDRFDALRSD